MATGFRIDDEQPRVGQKVSVFNTLGECERYIKTMLEDAGSLSGHAIYRIDGEWHRGSSEYPDGFTIIVNSFSVVRYL